MESSDMQVARSTHNLLSSRMAEMLLYLPEILYVYTLVFHDFFFSSSTSKRYLHPTFRKRFWDDGGRGEGKVLGGCLEIRYTWKREIF